MIAINLDPQLKLTDEIFEQICRRNPNLRLERSAQGELIAMPPTGSESGRQSLGLSAQLWVWNQRTDFGVAFDSSTGFKLPNGAIRSPDAAWVKKKNAGKAFHQNKSANLLSFARILLLSYILRWMS